MGCDAGRPNEHPEVVRDAVRWVTRDLAAAGIDEAGGDARRLVAAATGCDGAGLIRDAHRVLTADEAARLSEFVARRVRREPVSRILGEREFYGRTFQVTPDVLDPRADTETLIEVALEIGAAEGWRERGLRILDIGVGSGVLLVTLLAEWPMASGFGIDVSAGAVACARANAERVLGAANDAQAESGKSSGDPPKWQFEIQDASAVDMSGFDLVISNPPYIESAAIAGLEPEVRLYDPALALDGGADGLAVYQVVLEGVARAQGRKGNEAGRPLWVVLEAGARQADQIVEIARKMRVSRGTETVIVRRDLGGNERCVAFGTHLVAAAENSLD